MNREYSIIHKSKFYSQIFVLYFVSIAALLNILYHPQNVKLISAKTNLSNTISQSKPDKINVLSGLPIRIVIPNSSYNGKVVDLPIDKGYYNSETGDWTLSGYRAQFAVDTTPANNLSGETYIYGHNNDFVFGALRHNTPEIGSDALIYTANGHIFSYSFVKATDIAPDFTSVLEYSGPSILVIQTCTGSFNQVRTLYYYNFLKVIQ